MWNDEEKLCWIHAKPHCVQIFTLCMITSEEDSFMYSERLHKQNVLKPAGAVGVTAVK